MKNTIVLFFVFLVCSYSFAGKVDIAVSDNKVTKAGIISLYAEWVKDKGKKYDIGFNIRNESDKGIIVLLSEMRCYRGKEEGVLKHTFFNTGEKTINFRSGELKSMTLVCRLTTKEEGEYRITVGHVYANASGDGKTLGKELLKNVEWKVRIAE
jgi:hypothetical protein